MNRRSFLAAAAAATGAVRSASAKPVRATPLHANYFGPLYYDAKERQELISKSARLAYPIRDGIPVMLEEEARRLEPSEYE